MKKILLFSVCYLVITGVVTASAETASNVRYEQGRDENAAISRYLDIDLGLYSKNHVVFGYGHNTSKTTAETLASNSFYIGMLTDPAADTATGITYTAVKEKNSFDLDGIKLDFISNTDNWAFSLSPELRNIAIHTTSNSTINTLSPALGFVVSYYAVERLYLTAGITVYDYDKDIAARSSRTIFRMRTLSSTASEQNYGLDDYRTLLTVGYNYGAGNVGVRHTRSVATIDAAATRTNSLYVSYKFNDAWRTELTTGTVGDSADQSRFISVALGYHW